MFGFLDVSVAMEENLRRDNYRDQPPSGELEVPSRWSSVSGFPFFFFLNLILINLVLCLSVIFEVLATLLCKEWFFRLWELYLSSTKRG